MILFQFVLGFNIQNKLKSSKIFKSERKVEAKKEKGIHKISQKRLEQKLRYTYIWHDK